jgi:hypothetical protein
MATDDSHTLNRWKQSREKDRSQGCGPSEHLSGFNVDRALGKEFQSIFQFSDRKFFQGQLGGVQFKLVFHIGEDLLSFEIFTAPNLA